jgi:hypothetical protein
MAVALYEERFVYCHPDEGIASAVEKKVSENLPLNVFATSSFSELVDKVNEKASPLLLWLGGDFEDYKKKLIGLKVPSKMGYSPYSHVVIECSMDYLKEKGFDVDNSIVDLSKDLWGIISSVSGAKMPNSSLFLEKSARASFIPHGFGVGVDLYASRFPERVKGFYPGFLFHKAENESLNDMSLVEWCDILRNYFIFLPEHSREQLLSILDKEFGHEGEGHAFEVKLDGKTAKVRFEGLGDFA